MADKGQTPKPVKSSDGDKGATKPPNPGRSIRLTGTEEGGVTFAEPTPEK